MFFSKTYPSFLTVKEGSTFLTKPLFPQGQEDVTALSAVFAPTVPPQREGPYPIPKPKIPTIGIRDVTALRCSEPLRYKVGGPIKGLARLCGMGPHGDGVASPIESVWANFAQPDLYPHRKFHQVHQ